MELAGTIVPVKVVALETPEGVVPGVYWNAANRMLGKFVKSKVAELSAPKRNAAVEVDGLAMRLPKVLIGFVSPVRPIDAFVTALEESVRLAPEPRIAAALPKTRPPWVSVTVAPAEAAALPALVIKSVPTPLFVKPPPVSVLKMPLSSA